MKALDDSLSEARKYVHRCFTHPDSDSNPATKDLIYCGILFIAEVTKAACGCRPQSSSRLAREVAATYAGRIRFYRREAKARTPTKTPAIHTKHV